MAASRLFAALAVSAGLTLALAGWAGAARAETCTLPAVADQVDLKAVPGTDLLIVPVAINGKPKEFLLDIGTGNTEVSQATVAELGLPQNFTAGSPLQFTKNGNLANQQYQQMQVPIYETKSAVSRESMRTHVRIAAFTIGRATGNSLQFVVSDDKEMGSSEPYDGLLTGDFFKQYDVELDFAGKELTYLTPTRCTDPDQVAYWPHADAAVIPMTISDGKIAVEVNAEGHVIHAVIDTSSARTVMRRDIAEVILGFKPGTPDMMPAEGLKDGAGEQVYAHTFSQISFAGGVTANNVPVLIETNSMVHGAGTEVVLGSRASSADARIPDLTLGMDVLHQLHLYFVFGQNKLYATPAR